MENKAIFICGYGGSGKDTLAAMLSKTFGLTTGSSSFAAKEQVFRDYLDVEIIHRYVWEKDLCVTSAKEFYLHRRNYRPFWYDRMRAMGVKLYYNMVNANGAQIITGVRDPEELRECKEQGLVLFSTWVSRPDCFEREDSCPMIAGDCDFILNNNGTLADLEKKVQAVWRFVIEWNAAGPDEDDWLDDEPE